MRRTFQNLTNGQTWTCPAGVTYVSLAIKSSGSTSNPLVYAHAVPVAPGTVYTATVGVTSSFAGITTLNAAGNGNATGSLTVYWSNP